VAHDLREIMAAHCALQGAVVNLCPASALCVCVALGSVVQ
jgi:hypothetical protein